MKNKIISTLIFLALCKLSIVSWGPPSYQFCTIPSHDNQMSGDDFYGEHVCNDVYMDFFWDVFDFDEEDWDDGFGYEDQCNINLPLARTYNALLLLAYSAQDYAESTDDYSGNALRWAFPYCATVVEEFDAACYGEESNTLAATMTGGDERTEFYLDFFYDLSVSERAGTIVHECRHYEKGHNGDPDCPRGRSCDSDWEYQGANMFQVLYLWWFAEDGTRTTSAMRDLARNRAKTVHNTGFVVNPGFSIGN